MAEGFETVELSSEWNKDEAWHDSGTEPAKEDKPTAADLFFALRRQELEIIPRILKAFPEMWNAQDDDGHTILHWVALFGHLPLTQQCIEFGVKVDVEATGTKQTALMWACLKGHVHVAQALIAAGANIEHQDSLGATSLIVAVQHKQYWTILLLMRISKERALLRIKDNNGCGPAHWAAYKGDQVALKLLDYFEADLLAVDNMGMLPMHRAANASQFSVMEFLLEKQSDINLRNNDGKTVIDIAKANNTLGYFMRLKNSTSLDKKVLGDLEKCVPGEDESRAKSRSFREYILEMSKDKTTHRVFPAFWLICVSLSLFQYITDIRSLSWEHAPYAAMLFEIGAPFAVALFAVVALSDPGTMRSLPRGQSGVEQLMQALDKPGQQLPDVTRLCTTTWVLKDRRSKYCTVTGACVQEFDHYCVWLNVAIGKRNHRTFVMLAIVEALAQIGHIWCLFAAGRQLPEYQNGVGQLFIHYPLLIIMGIIQCITMPLVCVLILHQARLIALNMTTNEMMNIHRYRHFWVMGRFNNPFHKGGVVKNCLDFWWTRRRAQDGSPPACHVHKACCQH